MKNLLHNPRIGLYCKRIIASACFLAIIAYVYASATYLFRGTSLNEFNDDRRDIVGIKEENSLDMIYIGGSDVYCSFSPLQAWNDYGFTSYDLGSTSLQTENVMYLLKHALKYQDPQLLVISLRPFLLYSGDGEEGGLRYTADALDLGLNRLQLIKTYFDRRPMDDDICSYYIDIAKHHSRYELLSSPESWGLMNNRGESLYKGSDVKASYYYIDELPQSNTGGRREPVPLVGYMLRELLDFCKEKDLNVLFVEAPCLMSQEQYELYNTMDDIVTSYGFRFLNTNEYFEEMKIDISRDFIDKWHVNVFGMEKYTSFLGKYIVENYGLPDHRVEGNAGWDEAYAAYANTEEIAKITVEDLIASVQEGIEIAKQLHDIEDLAEWCSLVDDPRFTILAVGDGETLSKINDIDKEYLEGIGLTHIDGNNLIRVSCDSEVLYSNENIDESIHAISIGAENNVSCVIDNENQALSIMIDDEEYSRKDENGINIVVFQNDCRNTSDSLTVLCNDDGTIKLAR